MVRASDRCTEGHGFDSRRGLRFFFVPRSRHAEYSIFSYFFSELKIHHLYLSILLLLLLFCYLTAARATSISTGSSEDSFSYHGDVEDCLSVISENDRVIETLSKESFEEQEEEEEEEEEDDDDDDNDEEEEEEEEEDGDNDDDDDDGDDDDDEKGTLPEKL